jgi:hypothetical protein
MASLVSKPIDHTDPLADPLPQPAVGELLLLVLTSALVFIVTCSFLRGWHSLLLDYGDNDAYLLVANAISHWNFHNIGIQHFMGYPYFIALLEVLLRVHSPVLLVVVAFPASVLATLLTARLFGTTVAAYFALTNLAWLQISFLGGSEPLAVALGLAALWAFRSDKLVLASVLASLSVTVRPLMASLLVGIGLALLFQKRYFPFLKVLAISLLIGALYVTPLALYFGDPLLTVHSYSTRDYGAGGMTGPHGHLFGWPFQGIIMGTILYPAPWTNLVLSFFWIFLVLAGAALMFSPTFRRYAADHPAEAIFCGLYLYTVFSYDYYIWARGAFIRFAIPALPFVFFALLRYLPRHRAVLWTLAILSPLLAALSAVGVRNVIHLP